MNDILGQIGNLMKKFANEVSTPITVVPEVEGRIINKN